MFLALELCLIAIAAALAYIRPRFGERWLNYVEERIRVLARRRILAVVVIGLLAITARLALLPILPIPVPEIADEYSHLLLADTLSHGRLANPTHPMWVHFETFHVNWHPTYASMYYPGHALFLAFGQAILGHPFWGVVLSSGLMCAAFCWALQGWVPPGWAFVGSLLAIIRIGTFSYWVDSYWGGTVCALGGALVLGALPRIKQNQRPRDAVLMAIGMGFLASTRPYEGLFFCVPVVIALLLWATKGRVPLRELVFRVAIPGMLVLFLQLAVLSFYFWRVTGNPLMIPYQLNMHTYGLIYFPWDKIKPVAAFHHAALRDFYRGGPVVGLYNLARQHPFKMQFAKALVIWLFYFGTVFSVPAIVWLFSRPHGEFRKAFSRELRFLLLLCAVTYVALMLTIYIGQPHYAAPMTIAFYAILMLVLRDLYHAPHMQPSGRFLARSVPLVCFALLLLRIAAPAFHMTPQPSWIRIWCSQDWQNLERARVLNELDNLPGKQLVIVRYQPNHDYILDEWVFNNADIDGSKVIWARDMGSQNAELLQYFRDRHAWIVEPDYHPAKLSPYAE